MVHAVIVAAGRGTRMGLSVNKVFAHVGGMTVLERTVRAFAAHAHVDGGIVVVATPGEEAQVRTLLSDAGLLSRVKAIATGGADRQASVLSGLRALETREGVVLIHDGARPFVSDALIDRCIQSARDCGSGVAAVPLKDTIKEIDAQGFAVRTPPREQLRAVQTPQAFSLPLILSAHEQAEPSGRRATDDAALVECFGQKVALVEGEVENIKLTTPEDLYLGEQIVQKQEGKKKEDRPMRMRIGHGYDVHRLVEGRALILCGVTVPHTLGLLGHSDADVATHALMDALLGAAALGDIGRHFPDTDPAYEGADSLGLLDQVMALLASRGYAVGNVDVTIIAQRPKLKDFIPRMRENLAQRLHVDEDCVNVKATTTEKLGFEGEQLGISAHAVACIVKA